MRYSLFFGVGLALITAVSQAQIIDGRASTVEEGWQRGHADISRARGDANLSNSQAASNLQDAYSKAINNSVDAVSAYWERRNINEQQRASRRRERRSYTKYRNQLHPLTAEDFDRTTGTINWPEALASPEYTQYREQFDAIFKKRAQDGWLDSNDYLQAASISKEWRADLTAKRGQVPTDLLSQMVRFVLRLDRELNNNLS